MYLHCAAILPFPIFRSFLTTNTCIAYRRQKERRGEERIGCELICENKRRAEKERGVDLIVSIDTILKSSMISARFSISRRGFFSFLFLPAMAMESRSPPTFLSGVADLWDQKSSRLQRLGEGEEENLWRARRYPSAKNPAPMRREAEIAVADIAGPASACACASVPVPVSLCAGLGRTLSKNEMERSVSTFNMSD
jgi:hypothetical protein